VESGPPQPSLSAGAHGFRKGRPLRREGVADHGETFGFGGEEIERVESHFLERVTDGALTRRIEPQDLVDPIIVEDNPQGLLVPIVDVDDPTPNGKLAGFLDQVDPPIARRTESIRQPPLIEDLTRRQSLDLSRNRLGQRQGSEHCSDRDHDDLDLAIGHPPQQANQLDSRGEGWFGALVGRAEVTRDPAHTEPGCENLQPGGKIVNLCHVGYHHHCHSRFPAAGDERGHRQRSSTGNHSTHRQRSGTTIEGLH